MYYKLLLATFGFLLTCNLALAETATFKNLENNVYDVQELTNIGTDYNAFSQHVTELGLALGRYKRELNGAESVPYETMIKEAAEIYVQALDNWRKSFKTDGNESTREVMSKTYISLRDSQIKRAAKRISEAEALKNTIK